MSAALPPTGLRMCTLHPVLGLLLVGALRAFPQVRGRQEPAEVPVIQNPIFLTTALSSRQCGDTLGCKGGRGPSSPHSPGEKQGDQNMQVF